MNPKKETRKEKKRGGRLLAVLLPLSLLAACQNEVPSSSFMTGARTSASSPSAEEPGTEASPTPTEKDAPEEEATPENSAIYEAPEAPERVGLPEDFRLSDDFPEYEAAEFTGFSSLSDLSFSQADEAAIEKAIAAYRESALYAETIEELKDFFSYENGELICAAGHEESFLASRGRYLDPTAAPELVLKPEVVKSFRAPFDGTHEASLILLRTALPETELDWSGHSNYHIPVYVSADGEARILYDACRQDYGEFRLLYARYDLPLFALFGFGHNQGGQRGALYSFAEDEPKLELSGGPLSVCEYDGLLLGGSGRSFFEPILYDLENRECFVVESVVPNEELAALLCADPTILNEVPDAREIYEQGLLRIVGGKYVTFGTGIPGSDTTFVYDRRSERFQRLDQPISSYAGTYREQEIKTRRVNLGD